MSSILERYLRGKAKPKEVLVEYNFLSPGAASGGNPGMMTGRSERLQAEWQNLMIQLNTLWLDVMDADTDVYEEAQPTLQDLRHTPPNGCRSAIQHFKTLSAIIRKRVFVDKYSQDKDLRLYLSRMDQLREELQYICDEYDPETPKPPGSPIKSKEEWDNARKEKKKADLTFEPKKVKKGGAGDVPKPPTEPTVGGEKKKSSKKTEPKKSKKSDKKKPEKKGTNDKKKKPVKESFLPDDARNESFLPPSYPSVVMASLGKAANAVVESGELESAFLDAGDAIRLAMEEHTDVEFAHVEVGAAVPGSIPRLDLFVEWDRDGEPSESYGYCRLFFNEAEGLLVMNERDEISDTIGFDEEIDDAGIAERIYESLSLGYDQSPQRVWTESATVRALYGILQRATNGEPIPQGSVAQVLSGLRNRLGMEEQVKMVGQEISVVMEDMGSVYDYHFSWLVRQPLTHLNLPDELDKNMDDPPPGDLDSKMDKAGKGGYLRTAPIKDIGDKSDEEDEERITRHSYFGERNRGSYSEQWITPTVSLSVRDQAVYLVHEGEKEKLPRDMKDEDIAARLASMAKVKESSGRIIENPVVQYNRKDFMEAQRTCLGSWFVPMSVSIPVEEEATTESHLGKMRTDELHALAVEMGLKVPGDGVTWDRDKLIAAIRADLEWK